LWLVYFIAIVNQPYIGINAENINGQWVVTSIDPYGEGYKLGIRVGDLIVKIGTEDVHKYQEIKIWGQVEGVSKIEIRKMSSSVRIINIPKHSIFQMTFRDFPLPILSIVFGFMGFITWYKRRFWLQARTLYWLNWFIALAIILAPASERGLFLARELEYIFLSAVPIFLVRFISVFPSEKVIRVNRWGRLIVTLMFIIVLIITVLQSAGFVHIFDLLRKLVLATVSIGIIFTLGNLSASLMMSKDMPEERNQAIILLLGLSIGFMPLILLSAIPLIFGFQPIMDAHVSSLFISAIPLTWYIVVVNKYLPDGRRLFATVLSHAIALVSISFLIFNLRYSFKLLTNSSLEQYSSILGLLSLLVICFSLIRVLIIKLFEKYSFIEGKQTFKRRILELKESLTAINEDKRMLEEIVNRLEIEGAFIIAEDDKGRYLKKAIGIFSEKPNKQAKLEEYFQADQRINLEAKILPDDLQAEIYIPFVSNEFRCGIFLGHRFSHVKFEQDELPYITLISSFLAERLLMTSVIKELSTEIKDLAQRSLDSQRRSQWLQRITNSLFRNIELERKSIAREIHDGPLQLALDLNRWLDEIAEVCPSSKDGKAFKAIAHQREIIRNLNFELRSLCSDLRPPSLSDLGLYFAIESLCEEIMQKESILISLETVGFNEEVSLKEEIELVAYRFLQEGIANAVKHSGSNEIKIKIELDESKLELSIRDFGKGFDIGKIDELMLTNDHFGLIGMKERFQAIGGELQIISTISQGTILIAAIPTSERKIQDVS
jgi:two-component system sensor histidine kinase ComP